MSKFKVGEVVILKSVDFPEYNGKEIMIIRPFIRDGEQVYVTDFEFEHSGFYDEGWLESSLRKKHDGDEKPSWEAIESITKWHPNKVVV